MYVGLTPLQSSLMNISTRQHVFKPIVYLVVGIALAIISGLVIGRAVSRIRASVRSQQSFRQHAPATSLQGVLRGVELCAEQRLYRVSPTLKDLEKIPYEYIKSVASAIKSMGLGMHFEINFRMYLEDKQNINLFTEEAYDAGGPTRQFFNLLFQSLKKKCSYRWYADFYPRKSNNGVMLLVPQGEPTNNPEASIFYAIGIVMMYVYFHPKSPLIGPVFHESIFSAILSLNDAEINTPFHELNDATKVKMCKALFTAQQASGENDFAIYLPILAFLEKGDQFTEDDLTEEVKYYYSTSEFEWEAASKSPREFLHPGGDVLVTPALNIEAIMQNQASKRHFINKYLQHVLLQETTCLGITELTLFPIHTMAKGMKEVFAGSWTRLRSRLSPVGPSAETIDSQIEAAKTLQRKVQGGLDREVLVSKIKVFGVEIVQQQCEWIKAWILESETTDTLVEGLLTFWTGSPYVDWDKVECIAVSSLNGGLLPTSSTCNRALYVSSHRYVKNNARGEPLRLHNETKEGFYQVLNKIAGEYCNVYTNR